MGKSNFLSSSSSLKEMIEEGFDQARLVVLGHPYLAGISKEFAEVDKTAVLAHPILAGLRPGAKTILFVSEAIEEHYGNERGYTQYTALAALIANLKKTGEPVNLVVKLHPKDDPLKFKGIAASPSPCILVSAELSPIQSLAVADVVCGMTSILFIEAFLAGRPVFSVQPGLRGEDLLVISRLCYVP